MLAIPGYPLLCVPLVELVDEVDSTQGWTHACIPHEPHKQLRVNTYLIGTPGYPFTGRDTAHRHAVLIVQIAIHAHHPQIIERGVDYFINAHERFDIAVTPAGDVFYRPRPQHRNREEVMMLTIPVRQAAELRAEGYRQLSMVALPRPARGATHLLDGDPARVAALTQLSEHCRTDFSQLAQVAPPTAMTPEGHLFIQDT